jgi:flagellar motility protein MotE (MotC chaperone)
MRLRALFPITSAALFAAGLFYAQADDAQRESAEKSSVPKTSAPVSGSASIKKDNAKKGAFAKPAVSITPEREAAVLTFVQRNHAELADLLAVLKMNQPEEYDRAFRDIFRAMERINQIQERDPLQYELEVAAWTAQSRVQLLAAKLKMGSTDDLLKKLRDALATQNGAKLALLKHERQKAVDRLSKIDSDIARFETDREDVIDKQLKLLTRSTGEVRPAKLLPKSSTKVKATTSNKD